MTFSTEFALMAAALVALSTLATYLLLSKQPDPTTSQNGENNPGKAVQSPAGIKAGVQQEPPVGSLDGDGILGSLEYLTNKGTKGPGLQPERPPPTAQLETQQVPAATRAYLQQELESLILDLSPEAHAKGIDLELCLPPNLPAAVEVSIPTLMQVNRHLVKAAIQNTQRGHVQLRVNHVTDHNPRQLFQFQVIDTGFGYSDTQQAALFKHQDGDANGMNWAKCQTLVQALNGDLRIRSAPDQGTTVWFHLPLTVLEGAKTPHPSQFEARRFLLVDSVAASRQSLSAHLKFWDAMTHCAATASEAIGFARNIHRKGQWYDALILDLNVRGGSIDTLLEALEEMGSAPVILLGRRGVALPSSDRPIHGRLERPLRQADIIQALSHLPKSAPETGSGDSKTSDLPPSVAIPQALPSIDPATASPEEMAKRMIDRHILIVDDNTINRTVAQSAVLRFGCHVDLAVNGQEAVDRVSGSNYDMVLMDCQMPVMDGYEATRQIRQSHSKKDLPIIAVTANVMPGDRERCMQAGMNDYIAKPVRAQTLLETMSRHIGRPIQPKIDSTEPLVEPTLSLNTASPHSADNGNSPPKNDGTPPIDRASLEEITGGAWDLILDLMDIYISDAHERLVAIRHHIADQNHEGLGREAHSLKGASANLGAKEMSRLASALEQRAKKEASAGYDALYEALTQEYLKIKAYIPQLKIHARTQNSLKHAR